MEITLTRASGQQVAVACDGTPSHTFDLQPLLHYEPLPGPPPQPPRDPVAYGRKLYGALFPGGAPKTGERILLIVTDEALQAVPWEYAHGPHGFLVLDHPFLRGLPPEQRIDPPSLDRGLHIVAVPSQPLDEKVTPLNIEGEWARLREIVEKVPQAITLERVRPPTVEELRAGGGAAQPHRPFHGPRRASR